MFAYLKSLKATLRRGYYDARLEAPASEWTVKDLQEFNRRTAADLFEFSEGLKEKISQTFSRIPTSTPALDAMRVQNEEMMETLRERYLQ